MTSATDPRRRRPDAPRTRRRPARGEPPLPVDPEPDDDHEHPHLAGHRPVAAGHVLLVMLAGLLLGALLNADRMAERAEQKSFDDPWRGPSVALWGGLEAVADAVGLTRPRQAVEAALGQDEVGASDADVADLVERQPVRPAARDEPPTIRTPTAAEPLRLYLGGDSMARSFGIALQRVAGTTGIITPTIDHRVVSGLSRPDYFNWPQHLAEDVVPTDPEVVVLLFGANDAQSLRLDDGTICRRFERCWIDEYRRRVAGTMDLLRDPDGDRIVVWLGQPIMGPATGVDHVDLFNAIYEEQAAERPWVRYVDTWSWFSRPDGSYAAFLPAADGSEQRVREPDDVHLTVAGGERLSWALLRLLGDDVVDLSAWPGEPRADALPPDRPRPRGDLPEPAPRLVD